MIIHIMDPGLRDLTGHHYDFVSKLYRQLTKQGHVVSVYANTECDIDIATPHFRSFPYPQHHGEILDYHDHSRLIQEDLQSIPDADYWIWPSVFSFQVNGFRMSNRQVKSVGCVHVEHDFHHDAYGTAQWLHSLTDNFTLFAMEHKLVQDYTDIGVPCGYAPNPADNIPLAEPKSQLTTIGFFGHQRADKGADNVIPLVEQLINKYNVILHDSAGVLKYTHPKVTCYASVPVLADIIRQCDLVILPYNRNKYRKMSSGILCESLSVGVPCIVPDGTTQADWVNITHAGLAFKNNDILETIEQASDNYRELANNAYQTATAWPAQYGIEKFIKAMIK